jgi:hypothetical protein
MVIPRFWQAGPRNGCLIVPPDDSVVTVGGSAQAAGAYREGKRLGVAVDGVAATADGRFDNEWRPTGIAYSVTVHPSASAEDIAHLRAVVVEGAGIPRALRAGVPVTPVTYQA